MRLEKFLKEALAKGVIVSNITDLGWVWHTRRKYADLTSLVDFECAFDEDGVCRIYQYQKLGPKGGKVRKEKIEKVSRCCCTGCRTSVGYLRSLPNYIGVLMHIAELFNEKTGFWRLGGGCVLPREYRSNICLLYMCRGSFHKPKKENPFGLLKYMMQTPYIPDYMHLSSSPPKTFKYYNTTLMRIAKREWITYEEIRRMLLEDKAKRERNKGKKAHGNN